MEDDLLWLQKWYQVHCDGDWEHDQRIRIKTIDNPGWSVTINLMNTELQEKSFIKFEYDRSPLNWLICFVKDDKFEGRCGPLNLLEVLHIFRKWATKN